MLKRSSFYMLLIVLCGCSASRDLNFEPHIKEYMDVIVDFTKASNLKLKTDIYCFRIYSNRKGENVGLEITIDMIEQLNYDSTEYVYWGNYRDYHVYMSGNYQLLRNKRNTFEYTHPKEEVIPRTYFCASFKFEIANGKLIKYCDVAQVLDKEATERIKRAKIPKSWGRRSEEDVK